MSCATRFSMDSRRSAFVSVNFINEIRGKPSQPNSQRPAASGTTP